MVVKLIGTLQVLQHVGTQTAFCADTSRAEEKGKSEINTGLQVFHMLGFEKGSNTSF